MSAGGRKQEASNSSRYPHRDRDAWTSESRISAPVTVLEAAQSLTFLLGRSAFTSLASMTTGRCPQGQCQPSHCCPDKAPLLTQSRRRQGWGGVYTEMAFPTLGGRWGWSPLSQPGWAQKALPCSLEHEGTRAFTLLRLTTYSDAFVPARQWATLSTSTFVPACDSTAVRVWTLEPSAWVRVQALPFLSCVTLSKSPYFSVPQFPNVENGTCLTALWQGLNDLTRTKGLERHPPQ